MKVMCCGCGTYIKDKPSDIFDETAVSHGLCDSCFNHFMAQVGMPLNEYLETIQVPVVTTTSKGKIGTANKEARELLGKSFDQIHGNPGGEVFECKYSKLPEGCGNTIHCSGCTIRNLIMDTSLTGRPHERVPAYLKPDSETESRYIELLISTEKKGGVVLLKIEDIKEPGPADCTEAGRF